MTVGQKIRKLRRERDWTQTELGKRTGIDPKNISHYETDHMVPSRRTLQKFSSAFEVLVDELLSEPDNSGPGLVMASDDPELFHLFKEVAALPEQDRSALKRILSLLVKHNRLQQVLAS